MKKILAIIICVCIAILGVGCSNEPTKSAEEIALEEAQAEKELAAIEAEVQRREELFGFYGLDYFASKNGIVEIYEEPFYIKWEDQSQFTVVGSEFTINDSAVGKITGVWTTDEYDWIYDRMDAILCFDMDIIVLENKSFELSDMAINQIYLMDFQGNVVGNFSLIDDRIGRMYAGAHALRFKSGHLTNEEFANIKFIAFDNAYENGFNNLVLISLAGAEIDYV